MKLVEVLEAWCVDGSSGGLVLGLTRCGVRVDGGEERTGRDLGGFAIICILAVSCNNLRIDVLAIIVTIELKSHRKVFRQVGRSRRHGDRPGSLV